jgi:hypothetical protein
VTITVNNADSSYLYTLASVLDTGAVASAITYVDTFAWGSTASTAATYTWSNVTVTGVPVGGEETWAGFTVIADGEGAGWVDTGADVLGWVYPYEGDDYIWSAAWVPTCMSTPPTALRSKLATASGPTSSAWRE